ncbi:unnamed protein product, partial [marine sediment metagenome]
RLFAVLALLTGVGIAIGLTLYALRQNVNLFYTPSQIVQGEVPHNRTFRLGGLVVKGSVKRNKNNLSIHFGLSDTAKTATVTYKGILPDLFREGQGIVALGKLNDAGEFEASEVLAKHDENYMPPEVKHAIKQATHT